MKTILLSRGWVAWVDDQDYDNLAAYKWCATREIRQGRPVPVYAARTVKGRRTVLMHKVILGGGRIDHIRHLAAERIVDNRRSNLRLANEQLNQANRRKFYAPSRYTSPFKGVSKTAHGWKSTLMVNKITVHLGVFEMEAHAALAYDLAAVKHFGEYSLTNFPVPGSTHWLFGEEARP